MHLQVTFLRQSNLIHQGQIRYTDGGLSITVTLIGIIGASVVLLGLL